jgi:hypothetical protein
MAGGKFDTDRVDVDGVRFAVVRNPVDPLPRHFLVERVTGVAQVPQVDTRGSAAGRSPDSAPTIRGDSIWYLTRHSLAEGVSGSDNYDASGPLDVDYRDDIINVRVQPSRQERFVVITERYHPRWKASIGDEQLPVFPTNAVMIGVRIPPQVDHVQLRFEPFSAKYRVLFVVLLVAAPLLVLAVRHWREPLRHLLDKSMLALSAWGFLAGRLKAFASWRRPQSLDLHVGHGTDERH